MRQVLPVPADIDPSWLINESADSRLTVADPRILDFIARFASRLLTPGVTRAHPELASLGYFLRKAELRRLAAIASEGSSGSLRMPRGNVFHVPPSNVDTVFVYSWALSAICGNTNFVRLSARSAGAAAVIAKQMASAFAESDPEVARTQRFVSFDHESPAFPLLSRWCDVRVIWGGDQAVQSIRSHPLSPAATDITFPDRFSMVAFGAAAVAGLPEPAMDDLVVRFQNDVWWFDQAACSSPRAIVWIGSDADIDRARERLFSALDQSLAGRGMGGEAAMAIERRVSAYGMVLESETATLDIGHERVLLVGDTEITRGWFGSGGFIELRFEALGALAPHIRRKDQTLSHFGVSGEELLSFARRLGGRGIDRMVPVGEALQFERMWDGYDLLQMFTRNVVVRSSGS